MLIKTSYFASDLLPSHDLFRTSQSVRQVFCFGGEGVAKVLVFSVSAEEPLSQL